MRKLVWLICIFAVLLHCGNKTESARSGNVTAKTVTVKVAPVRETIIAQQVKITGEIAPLYQVEVYPKANGIVVSESVALGSEVHKDQVLAEVKQDIPGMEFSNVKIKATNSGFITADRVEIGSRVSVQQPVYTISGLRPLYMKAKIAESLLGKIKLGGAIAVTVDAYPDQKFKGLIASISPIVDRQSRAAELKVKIANRELKLKPGMFARAYLSVGSRKGLVVPLDAIVQKGATKYVFQIEAAKAKQLKVKTGQIMGTSIEIIGKLSAGDKIVILGQNLLEDGTPVQTR